MKQQIGPTSLSRQGNINRQIKALLKNSETGDKTENKLIDIGIQKKEEKPKNRTPFKPESKLKIFGQKSA